jgi:single-stranded DNA-binding protein
MGEFKRYFISGSVGANPEVRNLPSGSRVCNFPLAYNCGSKTKEEKIWIKITAWDDMADLILDNIHQGNLVGMNGKLGKPEVWVKDETANAKLVFTCYEIAKYEKGHGFVEVEKKVSSYAPPHRTVESTPIDDDIPF